MNRTASRRAIRIASRGALGALVVWTAACVGEAESSDGSDRQTVPPTIEADLDPVTAVLPSAATRAAFAARRVSTAPGEGRDDAARAVRAGTLLTFEVREDVSTSSHAAGDVFALMLADPVTGSARAFMPKGSPARGIVTDARSGTGSDTPAVLAVHVVSVQADGRQVHLEGRIRSAAIESDAPAGEATLAKGSRVVLRLVRDLVY